MSLRKMPSGEGLMVVKGTAVQLAQTARLVQRIVAMEVWSSTGEQMGRIEEDELSWVVVGQVEREN